MRLPEQWTRRRVIPLLIGIPVGMLCLQFGIRELKRGQFAVGFGVFFVWLVVIVAASVYDQRQV